MMHLGTPKPLDIQIEYELTVVLRVTEDSLIKRPTQNQNQSLSTYPLPKTRQIHNLAFPK